MLGRWKERIKWTVGLVILFIVVQQFIFNPIIQPILVDISPIFSDDANSFAGRSWRTLSPAGLALVATAGIIFIAGLTIKMFFVDPYILGKSQEDYNEPIQADEPIYTDDGELIYHPDEHDDSGNG